MYEKQRAMRSLKLGCTRLLRKVSLFWTGVYSLCLHAAVRDKDCSDCLSRNVSGLLEKTTPHSAWKTVLGTPLASLRYQGSIPTRSRINNLVVLSDAGALS